MDPSKDLVSPEAKIKAIYAQRLKLKNPDLTPERIYNDWRQKLRGEELEQLLSMEEMVAKKYGSKQKWVHKGGFAVTALLYLIFGLRSLLRDSRRKNVEKQEANMPEQM